MRKTSSFILISAVLLIFLSACATIDVINLSELNVRVLIDTPDSSKGTTRLIRPAGTTSTFSSHGGRFTISTLPDEQYRQFLTDLQTQISTRLFEEGATLSAADVAILVQRLADIDEAFNQMAGVGASCSGYAPDFSSVTAILNWDTSTNNWTLECSVATDE